MPALGRAGPGRAGPGRDGPGRDGPVVTAGSAVVPARP
ncbi:hypothetical protein Ae406Ps2_2106 [Pseudonocardia sp. Ae406_Ps2]|nr:hypothetical protein Ae406Ps2_2106 [Pseudonocardia sp. Ae406_Ps2]OLM06110.1 hypothetical protein Ae331Ps2_3820c [Pseudonocardia sp. Ae331_Ps2]OLM15238.1 hypothetical protein Ae505Ps2_5370 [Pseudonocardia sp. Ae505_Ps2]OLM23680.1 hypothetical protein Ae706Ps2_2113 [Pseudonocardia sp. Ae706_Ps2]